MSRSEPLVALLQEWIGLEMRHSMHSLILFLKEHDLSMSQVGALFQIQHGRTNVSDIAETMGVSLAAASQLLDRLVQQELVQRSEDPHDRRAKQLVLTDKGCRIVQKSMQARQKWVEDLAARLSPAEKEHVAAALKVLVDQAAEFEPQHTDRPHSHPLMEHS